MYASPKIGDQIPQYEHKQKINCILLPHVYTKFVTYIDQAFPLWLID